MLVPEIIIYQTLELLLKEVTADFNNTVEENTVLFRLFKKDDNGNQLKFNNFDYYEQAKTILLRGVEAPRKLDIFMGYNLARATMPTIHILLPSESPSPHGIGQDLGYRPSIDESINKGWYENYTQSMQATYNIMLTSENSSEVVLIYNFFKAGLEILTAHMEFKGLRNVRISGQDVNMDDSLVPPHIFHRNLMLSFFYESSMSALSSSPYLKKLCIGGTPIVNGVNID